MALPVVPDLLGRILLLREQRVMLSNDLATLYEVEPRALMQAVKRNGERFPEDFMFQLSRDEWLNLKSQNVISSWGGSRTPPYAFTEQGVAMLSSVLKSTRAVQANIEIMRTFIRLRRILAENVDFSRRLDELEQHYDEQFKAVFDALEPRNNKLDKYGCAGGMRSKAPVVQHGHSLQATGSGVVALQRLRIRRAPCGCNAAARPPARPECSSYCFSASLRQLMAPPQKPSRPIGFIQDRDTP